MGHAVRLFAGPLVALRAFEQISRHARIFALTPEATVFVVPFDEDLEDDVQQFQGTGACLDARGRGFRRAPWRLQLGPPRAPVSAILGRSTLVALVSRAPSFGRTAC